MEKRRCCPFPTPGICCASGRPLTCHRDQIQPGKMLQQTHSCCQILPNTFNCWTVGSHTVEVVWLSNPPPLEQIHQSLITLGTQAQVKPGRRALHGLCPGLQIHHLGLNDPSRKHPCPCSISLDVSKDHQKTDRSIAASTPQTEQTCLHI